MGNELVAKLKTFDDLKFRPHSSGDGFSGRIDFDNGYGVSVIRFKLGFDGSYCSYTSNEKEWELAVLHNGSLNYDTPITNDVVGHLSDDDVTEIMRKIQELPKNNGGKYGNGSK